MRKGALKIERSIKNSGKVNVGDKAVVYMATDVFKHLMESEGDLPLGKDLHPMTIVPCGIAIDAATEACSFEKTGIDTLRAMSFELESPINPDVTLTALAEIMLIGRRHVEVDVEVKQNERLILKGRVVLVRVREKKAQELKAFEG